VYFLTRFCGVLFLTVALITVILSIVDTAPEIAAANAQLGEEPINSSVKFSIGSEVVVDVVAVAVFVLFGWFLWSSEIQQSWAVAITFVLLVGSIVIRAQPLLPMDVAKHSPGLIFWGAKVVDDYYPSPLKPGKQRRSVTTFPVTSYVRLAVTSRDLSGSEQHPGQSVLLDFADSPSAMSVFYGQGGAQITGTLAGTRSVLDYDHDRDVYSIPHLMVKKIAPVGARSSR